MASRLLSGNIRKKVSVKTLPVSIPKSKLLAPDSSGILSDCTSRLGLRSVTVLSRFPADPVDHDAAIVIPWFDEDTSGIALGSYGVFNPILSESTSSVALGSYGVFVEAVGYTLNTSVVRVGSYGELYVLPVKSNWVKWSDIGNLDFTINKGNVAGERPLNWKGSVYAIKELGDKVIAYGENGVSALPPFDKTFGMETIYRVGLKGRNAVCGNRYNHFFVDKIGQMWRLSDSLTKLDYSEYLSLMNSSLVMSYDISQNLIYICDGVLGYVYNPETNSLGSGYINVSGFGTQGGTDYFAAPATIATPVFTCYTDIYDFGTRKAKTVRSVEIGTNVTTPLNVCLKYRRDKSNSFSSTEWRVANPEGVAFITCYGNEFQVGVKVNVWEYFEIDYINIGGAIHAY